MLSINTNLGAFIVQSSLNVSTNGLNQAIERMSTGFKINHAKDNAANYSINTNLSSKLSSYEVAQDNVSMGLDMVMTAMDSLDLISSHLSRMRDLAEQTANGTYSEDSLKAVQAEVNARLLECDRVIENTEYNGVKLFEGVSYAATGTFIQEVIPLTEEEAMAQGYTLIKSSDDLQNIQNDVSAKYILMNDINLSGYLWTPIKDFSGEFNGNGYVINNLELNNPATDSQGLFSSISQGAKVSNLGLENVNIIGKHYTGSLAAYSNGVINNCYVTGTVSSSYYFSEVGGLIGSTGFYGSISYCYSTANVSGGDYVGGLVGSTRITVKNCYATGNIQGRDRIGGLLGYSSYGVGSYVSDSYATGNVISTGGNGGGGLVGESESAPIRNCFATGNVKLTNYDVGGGLIGKGDNARVYNSYASGKVTVKNGDDIGGLIGHISISNTQTTDCYYNKETTGCANGLGGGNFADTPGYIEGVSSARIEELIKDGTLPSYFEAKKFQSQLEETNVIKYQAGIDSNPKSEIKLDLSFGLNLDVDFSTPKAARDSLTKIDEYLKKISEKQTEFGAAYNRLESALETIGISIDNLTSTRSTIRDADIAEESSAYIRYQILQQAATTLMATANQTPSIALQLL
ncbi:TPA: hypothetical protein CPT87_08140 [Candidatus Gastranaerophilales bacterium HUM_5]|jgi:filamentous haemagglutinin family outer membrane protein|nr:MAG TPA: hypothetical protein CPT99_06180 [Candidatus Gastranaerophilales bacterium HUM_4]DAA89905.1 MAG TPA: hypothetical protein CPT87_08140 [Candidatus Gastranaerophilales bacterium HUM_5]